MEKVIDKIKKLLRLAESPNEHEARLAMSRAQELMVKYNITVQESEEEPEVVTKSVEEKTKTVSVNRKFLAVVLAKHYRVKVYLSGISSRITVIGLKQDVEIFNEVFTYAHNVSERLFKIYLKNQTSLSRSESIAIKNDYLRGFRFGLDEHLSEAEKGYALMVVAPHAVEVAYEKLRLGKAGKASVVSTGKDIHVVNGIKDGKSAMSLKRTLAS